MNGIKRSPSRIDEEEEVFSYSNSNLETERPSDEEEEESFQYTGEDSLEAVVGATQWENAGKEQQLDPISSSSTSSPVRAVLSPGDHSEASATASPKITANDEVSSILGCNIETTLMPLRSRTTPLHSPRTASPHSCRPHTPSLNPSHPQPSPFPVGQQLIPTSLDSVLRPRNSHASPLLPHALLYSTRAISTRPLALASTDSHGGVPLRMCLTSLPGPRSSLPTPRRPQQCR